MEVERISTNVYTAFTHEVFQKWVVGQVTSNIVVTWPEYITVPDLLQFELIHETRQHLTDFPNILEARQDGGIRLLHSMSTSQLHKAAQICLYF